MSVLAYCHEGFDFQWDLPSDSATLRRAGRTVWTGGLLPLPVIGRDGAEHSVAGRVDLQRSNLSNSSAVLALSFGDLADGTLHVSLDDLGVRFERLDLTFVRPTPLVSLYLGAAPLMPEQADVVPDLSRDFWPTWQAEGYCIPSAKGGPVQSFFRRWDFGHASLPLGHFGPSMGTPYAAAFPRPLYSCAMGCDHGWLAIGAGDVPDGAMTLRIRSGCGAIEYRYREDLWGPPPGLTRTWHQPLRLTWAPVAYEAYAKLFATFDCEPSAPHHQRSIWNAWGDFRLAKYDVAPILRAAGNVEAATVCLDEGWETFSSSGVPSPERLPNFQRDLAAIRETGMSVGFWQSAGWVQDAAAIGLSVADLLCGADGRPRRTNWSMNPHEAGPKRFCLDPSSPAALDFLRRRTRRVVGEYGASLLKLDFAYGLPPPDVAVARDPSLRGERMGFTLLQTIADAAREANPDVTLQLYSLHPLLRRICNLVSLDDLGDAGGHADARHEIEGHGQWSVWASLAGARGTAICASSGYNGDAEIDVLLNTAVIGAPGSLLSAAAYDDSPQGRLRTARQRALSRWHRRATPWTPLWLNSDPGRLGVEPVVRSWGRLEDGRVAALALRERTVLPADTGIAGWSGQWAVIAQSDQGIGPSLQIACIPFRGGHVEFARPPKLVTLVRLDGEKQLDITGPILDVRDLEGVVGFLVTQ